MGLALAAELNGYPGPVHVLALAGGARAHARAAPLRVNEFTA
jgi:hypothetical protein